MENESIQDAVFEPEDSVFRTKAWTGAWLEIYGSDSRIRVIDLGGRKNPLEMMYGLRTRLKRLWSVRQLALVGCANAQMRTPRSEYNHLQELVYAVGSYTCLRHVVEELSWDSLRMGDMASTTGLLQFLDPATSAFVATPLGNMLANDSAGAWRMGTGAPVSVKIRKKGRRSTNIRVWAEYSYSTNAVEVAEYQCALGGQLCDRYFGKRDLLAKKHGLLWEKYSLKDFESFVMFLNEFHISRWGNPCYDGRTQDFMREFLVRLADAGGHVLLGAMRVGGRVHSVQLDIEWRGRRYNLQSGFDGDWRGSIKLGSIHLGKAIEESIEAGKPYDLLVGRGRATNYKMDIATHSTLLPGIEVTRGLLANARSFQHRFGMDGISNGEELL